MSTTSPSPSNSAAASADSTSTPSSSSSSSSASSSPSFLGFIGISALSFCLVAYLMWRKLAGRARPLASTPGLNTRRPQNVNAPETGRPEMFNAWMGERSSDGLQWERSMPFSVMILTDAESSDAFGKGNVEKHRGARDNEKGEEQDPKSLGLQVAVLIAMPSLLHAGHATLGSVLRGELSIGLIEMPWIKEDRHSLKRNASYYKQMK